MAASARLRLVWPGVGSWPVLAALLLGLIWAGSSGASEESRALTRQGAAALGARDYAAALASFDAAIEVDPFDAEALFFKGAALNRLGRHAEAAANLDLAAALGSRHRDLDFEAGWALLQLGLWRDAVDRLRRYDEASPGRGQASEFLGRAYLGLGEFAAAEAALEEAVRRDPALMPTAL